MRRAVTAVRSGRAPEQRVSPTQARRDLGRLRKSGLSVRAISELTGIPQPTLWHVARRDRAKVSVVTAQRLAAALR
jgi:hypothetical protein